MIEWLPILLALVTCGIVAGLLAGLLGVGGGIVIVPVLYFIFQLLGISSQTAILIATGTSLLIIVPTSVSSIRAHHKKGNVDFFLVKLWAPFIILGVIAGAIFSTSVKGVMATSVFGGVAILVALNMLLRAKSAPLFLHLPNKITQALIASVIGAISVIMGIGGGTLGVPTLSAYNTPAHKAVGTAAAFGLIIAVPGALLMLVLGTTPSDAPPGTFGFVNLYGFIIIVPLTVLMAPLGVKLGSRLNGVMLKRLFALFLIMSGIRMLYQSLCVLLS